MAEMSSRVQERHARSLRTVSGGAVRALALSGTLLFALANASVARGAAAVPESSLAPPLPEAFSASPSPEISSPEEKVAAPAAQVPASPQLLARPSVEEIKVRELLRLTGSVNVGLQMMDRILDTFRRAMPQVPEETWTGFRAECDPRELEDAVVPLYLTSFTAGELDSMLQFYHSPVGEKLLRKQPEIFRASGEAGRQWAADLTFRLRTRLTEKGYSLPGTPAP